MNAKLSKEEFITKLKKLDQATSAKDDVIYNHFHFDDIYIRGIRNKKDGTTASFRIKSEKLHQAYCAQDEHNTKSLKKYVSGVQSPALAILLAAGLTKYKK